MTRLQKKCLIASACFHGLMVAVFLATAAFRSEPPAITAQQVLTLIPAKVLDTPGVGGDPVPAPVTRQPPLPASPPAPPAPPVVHPAPPPVAPPRPAPPPRTPPTPPAPVPAVARPGPAPAPRAHTITPSYDSAAPPSRPAPRSADTSAQTRAAAQASAQAAAQAAQAAARERAQEVSNAFAALGSSVRGRETPVSAMPLPGEGGGEAFVNYDSAVCNVYYNAWTPEASPHKPTSPIVKIVISRNGNVTSAEFVAKSGDPLLDRSVQRALDAVKEVPPFPPGSTDTERSLFIRFNPEAKQSAG